MTEQQYRQLFNEICQYFHPVVRLFQQHGSGLHDKWKRKLLPLDYTETMSTVEQIYDRDDFPEAWDWWKLPSLIRVRLNDRKTAKEKHQQTEQLRAERLRSRQEKRQRTRLRDGIETTVLDSECTLLMRKGPQRRDEKGISLSQALVEVAEELGIDWYKDIP